MRPLRHSDLRKFVETEGWVRHGTAHSKSKTGDHHRYTLVLRDGTTLYTRISHGTGQIDDPRLVAEIFREQLQVTEDAFYQCVEHDVLPPRPQPEMVRPLGEVLDAKLVRNLIVKVGLTIEEVGVLSRDEAVRAWQEYLSDGLA